MWKTKITPADMESGQPVNIKIGPDVVICVARRGGTISVLIDAPREKPILRMAGSADEGPRQSP